MAYLHTLETKENIQIDKNEVIDWINDYVVKQSWGEYDHMPEVIEEAKKEFTKKILKEVDNFNATQKFYSTGYEKTPDQEFLIKYISEKLGYKIFTKDLDYKGIIVTEENFNELLRWIKDSEDTNQFCTRSLLVDAVRFLDKDPPEPEKALKRLLQSIPVSVNGYQLVDPPDFAIDIENGVI
jgi:hypothetical protein